MTREIIQVSAGQAGNQIGAAFFNQISKEHGIGPNGALEHSSPDDDDRKGVFYYQADDNHYVPRAILLDLEPRVIDGVLAGPGGRMFNRESVFKTVEGGGAGNNWASGYTQAGEHHETILDMLYREAEGCDNLEGFQLCHSISGGTGSGLGSYVLQKLFPDYFPKKLVQSFSVFPTEQSDVVVQAYNAILTNKALSLHCDSVITLDNAALTNIALSQLRVDNPSFEDINSLIALVMSASTNPLRYPGSTNNTMLGMISSLVPTPRLHYLMTGYTPLTTLSHNEPRVRKTSVQDTMRRLLQPQNIMTSAPVGEGCFVSILNTIQGEVDPNQIHRSLQRIIENKTVKFIPWGPASIQVSLARRSPYIVHNNRVSGFMMANHTCVATLLGNTAKRFDKLRKREAFLDQFRKEEIFKDNLEEMDDARNVVQEVIDEYKAAEKKEYINWDRNSKKAATTLSSSQTTTSGRRATNRPSEVSVRM